MRSTRRAAAIAASLLLLLGACSTDDGDDDDPSAAETTAETDDDTASGTADEGDETDDDADDDGDGGSGGGDVVTGPGVTDDTITIGVLTDLSGPFAAGAQLQVQIYNSYWPTQEVCGRSVEVQVQDHGYDPQQAVSLYRSMEPDIAALQQLLGSPMIAALLPTLEEDSMFAGGMGWSSVVLPSEIAQLPGAPYAIEAANAVDYLVEEMGLAEGDVIGHLYFDGDFGGDSLAGAEYAAEQYGIEVTEQVITPADQDMSSQAAAFQQAGVSAVIIGAAPGQLGSFAGVAQSIGLDVPIFTNTPAWNPTLLDGESADALVANAYQVMSIAPYGKDAPGVAAARDLYESETPDGLKDWGVTLGYIQAELLKAALDAACEAGDLSREGIVAGMRSLSDLELDGLMSSALSYDEVGQPPTRMVHITKVNPDVDGGLEVLTTYEGPSAQSYEY
ncbi:MAG: ABC transporter substrate-binding protein [Actinomycetota bacterium]|nr:ABC transporter substrate-binding protein [Actinomycetota bacterium]